MTKRLIPLNVSDARARREFKYAMETCTKEVPSAWGPWRCQRHSDSVHISQLIIKELTDLKPKLMEELALKRIEDIKI